MPSVAIQPCRAAHLRRGHVVKLNAVDRRRVLWVATDQHAPVYIVGTWASFEQPAHVETFRASFARFFTIERD